MLPRRVRAAFAVALMVGGCSTGAPASEPAVPSGGSVGAPSSAATPRPTVAPSPSTTDGGAATWVQLSADGPAPREDHTWTVSGDGRTAFLFGGRDGTTVHDDLWAFSLADDTWTELPAGGPPARFSHEAVWADGIGLVVFAGQNGPAFFNDLWAFDPASGAWRELPSNGSPPIPRYGTCTAIGPDGRLWISHGFTSDGTRFADTRAYEFATGAWTDETPAGGEHPIERCLHACWWTDDGRFALYAGQTTGTPALGDLWLLDAAAWSMVDGGNAPAARNLYASARVGDATLIVGGQAVDATFLDDAWWLVDGEPSAIELTTTSTRPSGRSGATLIHDDAARRVLLFGGRSDDGALADLWALEDASAP